LKITICHWILSDKRGVREERERRIDRDREKERERERERA